MKDESGSVEKKGDAKGKKGGAFPRQKILAMTLVLLFIAVCVFLYYHNIQRNREHLTQHNLRHLGTISTVIHERLEAFLVTAQNMHFAVKEQNAEEGGESSREQTEGPTDQSIAAQAFNFPVRIGDTMAIDSEDAGRVENVARTSPARPEHKGNIESGGKFNLRAEWTDASGETTRAFTANVAAESAREDKAQGHKAGDWLFTEDEIIGWVRSSEEAGKLRSVRTTYADLLESSGVAEQVFDILLVVDDSGHTVLYNSAPRKMRITHLDSVIIDGVSVPFETAAVNSNVGVVNMAGTSFLIYMQPMGEQHVCGLLETDSFEDKTRTIHGSAFMDAMLIIILLLLAIPLITLHFADYSERIRPLNVLINIGAIILGSALVAVLIGDLLYGKYNTDHIDDRMLRYFSREIVDRSGSEFDAVDEMLSLLDSALLSDATLDTSHIQSLPPSQKIGLYSTQAAGPVDKILSRYPYLEQLYWLDANGTMVAHWTSDAHAYDSVPLGDREYFQKILAGRKKWIFPHYTRAKASFMLAYSRESMVRFRARSQSVPSAEPGIREASVGAVDFLPRSLVDVWMPEGYGYMIVDVHGDVLFHSIVNRALHENLFLECSNDALHEIMAAGAEGEYTTQYWGDEVRMFARPMPLNDEQPWYLVVYSEQDMLNDMSSGTLMTTAMMYVYFFFPILLGFVVYTFVWDKHLSLMWFRPEMGHWYRRTAYFTILISILSLPAALLAENVVSALLVSLVLPQIVYQIAFLGLDLRTHLRRPDGGTNVVRILRRGGGFLVHFLILTLMIILLCSSTPLSLIEEILGGIPWWLMGPALVLVLMDLATAVHRGDLDDHGLTSGRLQRKLPASVQISLGFIPPTCELKTARRWYRLLLTSVVVLVGLVPVIIFFRAAYDLHGCAYDRIQSTQYAQFVRDMSSDTSERRIDRQGRNESGERGTTVSPAALSGERQRSIYLLPENGLSQRSGSAGICGTSVIEDALLKAVLLPVNSNATRFRFNLTAPSVELPAMAPENGVGQSGDQRDSVLQRSVSSAARRLVTPRRFPFIPEFGGILPMAIIVTLFLFVLYSIIRYGTKRIFFSDLPVVRTGPENHADENRLILWTTAAERERYIADHVRKSEDVIFRCSNNWRLDTLAGWDLERAAAFRHVVLDRFEYRSYDASFNLKKLQALEHLLFTLDVNVWIICSVDPVYYFFADDGSEESQLLRDRWTRVLNMLVRVQAGEDIRREARVFTCYPADDDLPLRDLMTRECALDMMYPVYRQVSSLLEHRGVQTREELLRWLGIHCKPLYQSLWMTCTKRERLMLYRIAHDGFVPYKAKKEVSSLLERGLITRNPALCIFNASFQEFVREAKTPEQIRSWESQEATGLWGNIKHPLIIGFVLIAAALFYANPAYFDSTVAILTAMAGAIPLLLRVRGFLTGMKAE